MTPLTIVLETLERFTRDYNSKVGEKLIDGAKLFSIRLLASLGYDNVVLVTNEAVQRGRMPAERSDTEAGLEAGTEVSREDART